MKEQYAVFKYCGDDVEQESIFMPLKDCIYYYDRRLFMNPKELGYRIMKELTQEEIDKNRNKCNHSITYISDIDHNTYCKDCNEVVK